MLYEKTLKTSMVDKKLDEKEAKELKNTYNHYHDKRKENMKNTSFKVEDVFGDVLSKDHLVKNKKLNLIVFQQKKCEYKNKHKF